METKTYLTFSTEGLTDKQIAFLAICEDMFFDNKEIDYDFLSEAYLKSGYTVGESNDDKIFDVWYYWKFLPKPSIKESLKNPIKLSELLNLNVTGQYTLSTTFNDGKFEYRNFKIDVAKDLGEDIKSYLELGQGAYFELFRNEDLYIKQSNIISSFFLAKVINDLF